MRLALSSATTWRSLLATLVALMRSLVTAVEFPNNIVGLPEIYCGETDIEMTVETSAGNPSHMFVIGRHDDPACVTRNNNKITIGHESCGLTRERNLSPAGIMYRACISVQLHPQFVTKVDRTFCARCFYTEGVNELTRELEVSPQGSTEIPVSFDAPVCTYSIRKGSPTGQEIRYATVGEEVYHVWHCPSDMNGMLVQNCYVEDGQGNRILIIDQNGCGIDQYVMQTPNYTRDLTMAFQESHVFKFADKTITRFTCQIKICIKANDGCSGVTPPQNCPESPGPGLPLQSYPRSRFSRSLDQSSFELALLSASMLQMSNATLQPDDPDSYELDVSDELIVLDDPSQDLDRFLQEEFDVLNERLRPSGRMHDKICVPRHGAALMLVVSSAFGLFGVVLVIYLLKLSRRNKDQV